MRALSTLLTTAALTLAIGCGGSTTQIPEGSDNDAAAEDSGSSSSADSGGGAGSDSATTAMDATTTTQGEPTWTYLVSTYLASGKIGNCTRCHSQFSSPSNAYTYLSGKGYITKSGTPPLVSSNSCLSWYSGNMPPGGPSSEPMAVKDFNAWAAAGAKNN